MPLIGLLFGTILDNINLISIDIIASLILIEFEGKIIQNTKGDNYERL